MHGRPVEYSFCNTKGEANQAMACARAAVEDGVDAIVGRVDIFTTQSTPILEKGGIPDVGAVPISEIDYRSPLSFPLHSGNYGAFAGGPYAFKAAGKQRMVVVRLDFAATAAQADMVERVAAAIGMPSAGQIVVPAQGVTDYAPYAQQIKDRGADAAMVLLGPQGLQALYKAADALASTPSWPGPCSRSGSPRHGRSGRRRTASGWSAPTRRPAIPRSPRRRSSTPTWTRPGSRPVTWSCAVRPASTPGSPCMPPRPSRRASAATSRPSR
ncbi:hypothetical protein BJF78_14865 [Pseudonocardia sp. CNS-139]|nr:hypothetical protein BJF78_14865 [Pseudonocardia sp. CNS-139]